MNVDERQGLYRQIENQFFGETGSFPIAPLYLPGNYRLVQSWVTGYPPTIIDSERQDLPRAVFGGEQYNNYHIDARLKRLERSRVVE